MQRLLPLKRDRAKTASGHYLSLANDGSAASHRETLWVRWKQAGRAGPTRRIRPQWLKPAAACEPSQRAGDLVGRCRCLTCPSGPGLRVSAQLLDESAGRRVSPTRLLCQRTYRKPLRTLWQSPQRRALGPP